MIKFDKFTLFNGLKILVNEDTSTPLVAINLLYNVGAKDEDPERTGFAHLFEHLMFGGSLNIADYDTPLQKAGGENNAVKNNDYTNYYITLPANNVETGFWLESDRMLGLAFTEKSLEVQRQVVIEEFKQRYLNQPYGDVWMHLRPLAYKVHPYKWSTIGKDIAHIQGATMDDVKRFFFSHYAPNNCVLSVSGNISTEKVRALCQRYFAPIPARDIKRRDFLQEPAQKERRELELRKDVPYDQLYMAFQMGRRTDKNFHIVDCISDLLSNGRSARLYQQLFKKQQLVSDVNAYITGDIDKGLFVITAKILKGKNIKDVEKAILFELQRLIDEEVSDYELEKVKNKYESSQLFQEVHILNKAMNLAYFELLGSAEMVNLEVSKYRNVRKADVQQESRKLFRETNCSVMYYLSNSSDE